MRRLFVLALGLAVSGLLTPASYLVAKETDADVPLAGINASLQPDLFTGTLTGSIPIEVPPGRNGMQPNLTLTYASSGGNGWIGMGWKLEMGAIERQTRWGVLYQATTAEEQTGKVYTIRLNGVSTDLVQDTTDPLLYHEKVKGSFLRIKKLSTDGTAGWEITDTKGTKYKFGTGTATRVQGTVGSLGTQIFKWCLERVEDRDGNYMTVTYTGDQGQGYLSQIDYAGNGATVPLNQVKFWLEGRSDVSPMYLAGFLIQTAKRLKTEEILVNGTRNRAYSLSYEQVNAANPSRLIQVQGFGKDAVLDNQTKAVTGGTAFPSIQAKYAVFPYTNPGESTVQWTASANATDGSKAANYDYPGKFNLIGDFNGDGKKDVVAIPTGNTKFYVTLSTGSGWQVPQPWGWSTALPDGAMGANADKGFNYVGDVNGDGKDDIVYIPTGRQTFYVYISTGTGFLQAVRWGNAGGLAVDGARDANYDLGFNYLTDVDGDGMADIITIPTGSSTFYVLKSTGSGFTQATKWGVTSTGDGATGANYDRGYNYPVDVNGDGKADIMYIPTGRLGWYAYLAKSDGTGFLAPVPWFTSNTLDGSAPSNSDNLTIYNQFLDMNGDGRTDLVYVPTGRCAWYVGFSTGDTFTSPTNWDTGRWGCDARPFHFADVSGDGRPDEIHISGNPSGDMLVAQSNGTDAFLQLPSDNWHQGWGNDPDRFAVADFSGDGRGDLVHWSGVGDILVASVREPYPGLLTSLLTPLGGATIAQYLPSTQYTNTQLPYPIQTVSTVTTCDNWNSSTSVCNGTSSTTSYSYTGGYHQISERDFRGFKMAIVTSLGATDADKTVATTWFHQGNELTPIDTENQGLANGYMKGKPYRIEVNRKSDNLLYTKTEMTYLADQIGTDTTAPWFNPPAQVDNFLCDGGPCVTTRMAIAAADYDVYGNVLRESHYGDISVTGDEKTIERAFVPPNTTEYVVSAPARETIYQGIPQSTKLAETLFYYDGTGTGACTAAPTGSNTAVVKGKLTKIERWLSGGTNPISGMEYDPTTGVLLCSRDPLGNKTTLTYDPTKTFVLTSTNQVGHVTTTVYSGVNGVAIDPATGFYGTVKSVTDPNGKVVSHEYDALGRKTKTTAPDGLVTQVTYPTLAEFGVIGTQKLSTTTSGASLPAALTTSAFFDGLGRTFKKESSGPNGTTLVTDTQYDVKGQVFRTSLPYFKTTESNAGRWRTMTYDPLGRVTQVTHPDTLSGTALTSKSCYAPFITVILDPSGARKRETKDAYGRVVKIEEYDTTTSV